MSRLLSSVFPQRDVHEGEHGVHCGLLERSPVSAAIMIFDPLHIDPSRFQLQCQCFSRIIACLCSFRDSLMEYLVNVTTAQEFRPWEVSELVSRVKIDKALAQQCPQTG